MRQLLKKLTIFEKTFILLGIVAIIISSVYCKTPLITIITSISGIIYVFLIGKRKKIAYLFGIINVILYAFLAFKQSLFLGAIYNSLYSFPFLIYGYIKWGRIKENKTYSLNKSKKSILNVLCIVIIILIVIVLLRKNNQIIYFDYITTILGVMGIFLMTNKYKEQWTIWNICNISNTILWFILTKQDINNLNLFIMWFVYSINSIYGTISWKGK